MWLYHYQDNVIDEWELWESQAKKDGFRGFVKTGAYFETSYSECDVGSVGKSH